MKTQISIYSLSYDRTTNENVELSSFCPRCGVHLFPDVVYGVCVEHDFEEESKIFILNFCPKCNECFISSHTYDEEFSDGYLFESASPLLYTSHEFSSSITELSPDFVAIYNDSYHAESLGLTSICGMGYRKAIEFLIKDYIIYKKPSAKTNVISQPLMQCIKDHIKDDRLYSLAKASTWLGNDETHYVKRHTDYNIADLRKFINAFVTFIDADLAYESAKNLFKS